MVRVNGKVGYAINLLIEAYFSKVLPLRKGCRDFMSSVFTAILHLDNPFNLH